MDVYKDYSDYLLSKGCKEEIKAFISEQIESWKKSVACVWYDNHDPYDHSGDIKVLYDKKIGDIAKTDLEVLKCLTGDKKATYVSGRGWDFQTVGEDIGSQITDIFAKYYPQYISENKKALCEEFKLQPDCNNDDFMDCFWNEIMHFRIVDEWFPEYEEQISDVW